ncbi:transglutaminase-like cysteine peptidase [Patescibacteria group bacterium]
MKYRINFLCVSRTETDLFKKTSHLILSCFICVILFSHTAISKDHDIAVKNRITELHGLIVNNRDKSEHEKLELVNDFFNKAEYGSDYEIWGREDYWATPTEVLFVWQADCEDYSIAKYFTLLEMGVSVEKLRITYVKSLKLNVAHMVLIYYEHSHAEPLVLDNLTGVIKPVSQRRDLQPVYNFNGESLWLIKRLGNEQRVGSSDRIGLWRVLNNRMDKDVLL